MRHVIPKRANARGAGRERERVDGKNGERESKRGTDKGEGRKRDDEKVARRRYTVGNREDVTSKHSPLSRTFPRG